MNQVVKWPEARHMAGQAGVGPMLGQAHHFLRFNADKAPYAEQHYAAEAKRLYAVLDQRVADREYFSGACSIADMATWPRISRYERQGIDSTDNPNLERWFLTFAGL